MISTFQTHIQSMDSQEFDFNFFYKYLLMKTNSTNNTNSSKDLSPTAPTVNPNIPQIPEDESPSLNTGQTQPEKNLSNLKEPCMALLVNKQDVPPGETRDSTLDNLPKPYRL